MNNLRFFIYILLVSFSLSAFSQQVKVFYYKGNSNLLFDLETKSKLSSNIGVSYHLNKNYFAIDYINANLSYDEKVTNTDQILLNFENNIQTLNLSYGIDLGYIEKLNFSLGFNASVSNFDIYSNLVNSQDLKYEDFTFDELSTLGYFSENDFESSLSELNIDELEDYPTYFFSLGPSIECSYELLNNFEISAKANYRNNFTDLLDNVNSSNLRDISINSKNDNQIDLFVGFKFNITKNNKSNAIEQYDENEAPKLENDKKIEKVSFIDQAKDSPTIISKEEYISTYFENNTDSLETALIEGISVLKEQSFESEIKEEKLQPTIETKQSIPSSSNLAKEVFYVVIGVFSNESNLKKFAKSKDVDTNNYFSENKLFYLYAIKTFELAEAKQLRDNLLIDNWIYYEKLSTAD
jgi:hypothetical protein